MVIDMELTNTNGEETRSSSVGSGSVSIANCASARQSPKVTASPSISASASASVPSLAPSPSTLLLHRNSASPSLSRKIMSKNHNNTLFPTSFPSNLAELQLYRVMQNASLLYYYDTLLEMGGDDVQQLCDAGEEEFLEIMSLVGMASKPLHVRRLQKSLQEWVNNSTKFKLPLVPGEDFELELSSPSPRISGTYYSLDQVPTETNRTVYSPSPGEALAPVPSPGLCITKRPYSPLRHLHLPPFLELQSGEQQLAASDPDPPRIPNSQISCRCRTP